MKFTTPLAPSFYTVIISKQTGLAKAVYYQTHGGNSDDKRVEACSRNGNWFRTLDDAKAMAEKINNLFKSKSDG